MAEMSCEVSQSLIPEIALGVLHGRERAEALAHIEHCPACQHELLLMGDLADRLVELTPSAEPPVGFETRVLAALGAPAAVSDWAAVDRSPAEGGGAEAAEAAPAPDLPAPYVPDADVIPGAAFRSGTRDPANVRGIGTARSLRRPRVAAFALAAACLAVAVGIGGWAIGHHDSSPRHAPVASAGHATVANLVADHRTVGQVVVTGGGEPWVSMAMNTTFGDQQVTCQLREQNGKTVTLGSFKLKNGYGYWAAPIPVTTSPVVAAQLVGAHGATLATAKVSVAAFGH
jgi:hypothetical protein